ncbi:uncharacterized protein FIBRA_06506 [Fibroporia radiculosa]|uniref:Uncharacterized protein n=1 Tax=Fibroporia radiculosa TaxID=599839 RepID=J4H441_9APHY|nr:uncharacterized protein FIBRA_06506 [Fibroporia radiculosa]CCM04334.1 predicted protein [Fibroporia radiculosa]
MSCKSYFYFPSPRNLLSPVALKSAPFSPHPRIQIPHIPPRLFTPHPIHRHGPPVQRKHVLDSIFL